MKSQNLWAGLLSAGILAPVTAQAASPHHQVEEVIVTASPHGKSSGDVAGSLNVLSGETLRREAASTLGETLKNQTGINASSFGPGVGLPVIRGLSGSRVEVLNNSSPVADASQTSPDHAIALEPLLADRIEILRGPATLRYGPGAMGGVVNIIDNRIHTERHTGFEGALEARYNDNGDGRAFVGRLDGGAGAFNLHVSGLLRENDNMEIPGLAALNVDDPDETTDDYVDNTDAEADAWTLGLSHVSDNMAFGLAVSKTDNNYGIPPGGHGHHHDEDHHEDEHDEEEHEEEHEEEEHHDEHGDLFTRIDMQQAEYSAKLLLTDLPGNFDKLDIDLTHSDYSHRELEIEEAVSTVGTRYDTKADHLRAELTHAAGDWLGAVGLQVDTTEFTVVGEEAFVPPNQVDTMGIFATEETALGSGTLSLGLRYDRQTADPDSDAKVSHNLLNAAASYLIPLANNQQLSLIYTHSQRAPTPEELFSDGEHVATRSYQVGDAALDKEVANSLELTWSWDGPVQISAGLFHREFNDFIYEATDGSRFSHDLEEEGFISSGACSAQISDFDNSAEEFEESVSCYFYRQEDARFSGAEVEAVVLVNDNTSLRLWGDTVRARLSDSGDVPRLPPARLGANMDFSSGAWTAGIGVTHGFEQDHPGANESPTDSYTRIDAHVSVSAGQWTLFVKGSNLSDEEIRNATSFLRDLAPEPGRSIEIGGRFNF